MISFQLVLLIVSGLTSQIGQSAPKAVEEVFKLEKDLLTSYPEMVAWPVVAIPKKNEDAMNINVHVGLKLYRAAKTWQQKILISNHMMYKEMFRLKQAA